MSSGRVGTLQRECTLCHDPFRDGEEHVLTSCRRHAYHPQCLATHITHRPTAFYCPETTCDGLICPSHARFLHEHKKAFLTGQQVDRFVSTFRRAYGSLEDSPAIIRTFSTCPLLGCGNKNVIKLDTPPPLAVTCRYCHGTYCRLCHARWTEGHQSRCTRCQHNPQEKKRPSETWDKKELYMSRVECPRCMHTCVAEVDWEKSGVYCRGCRHTFCWKCRADYSSGHICPDDMPTSATPGTPPTRQQQHEAEKKGKAPLPARLCDRDVAIELSQMQHELGRSACTAICMNAALAYMRGIHINEKYLEQCLREGIDLAVSIFAGKGSTQHLTFDDARRLCNDFRNLEQKDELYGLTKNDHAFRDSVARIEEIAQSEPKGTGACGIFIKAPETVMVFFCTRPGRDSGFWIFDSHPRRDPQPGEAHGATMLHFPSLEATCGHLQMIFYVDDAVATGVGLAQEAMLFQFECHVCTLRVESVHESESSASAIPHPSKETHGTCLDSLDEGYELVKQMKTEHMAVVAEQRLHSQASETHRQTLETLLSSFRGVIKTLQEERDEARKRADHLNKENAELRKQLAERTTRPDLQERNRRTPC